MAHCLRNATIIWQLLEVKEGMLYVGRDCGLFSFTDGESSGLIVDKN